MVRPGVNVSVRTASAPTGPSRDTGTWYVVGQAERGPVDRPVLVRNMTDFETYFGDRVAYSELWDCMDVFFHNGGLRSYVQRYVGPAATQGTLVLEDRAGVPLDTLTVDSIEPGAHSADIAVQIADGDADDTFEIFVYYRDALKERSGDLASPTEAVAWAAATSRWITVTDEDSATASPNNNPAVLAKTALSAGTDDRASATDTHRTNALALMGKELGCGQVSVPGATTDAIHTALNEHAAATNRTALCDAVDDGQEATLVAAAVAFRADNDEPERSELHAPRLIVPGLTAGTTRTVPMSPAIAALMARNDGVYGTSVPAAGRRGRLSYALDVTYEFTDDERETLNEAGVNIVRPLFGPMTMYGYRTLSTDQNWISLSDQRLRMEIVNDAYILGEEFVFDQIDGQGHTIAAYGGALTAMLAGYYNRGALFGATPDEAFQVNVGDSVNTIETLANRELRAVLEVRMSPFAEMVVIEIVKTPITQSL